MTDELVQVSHDDEELQAVLAHEIGHVRGRHALRQIIMATGVSALAMGVLGDVSSVSALASAAPVLLHTKHSRDFEREADAFARDWLQRQGIPGSRFDDILCRMSRSARGNSPRSDCVRRNASTDHGPGTVQRARLVKEASAKAATARLLALANPAAAAASQRFFKTAAGEYGAGDLFRGIRVPPLRALARDFAALPLTEVLVLLRSPFHEDRLLALFLLNQQFALGSPATRAAIYTLYLENTGSINNWDLVDSSAEHIVGAWLFERSRRPLRRLARSANLWERRIAIIATFHFIRRDEFDETLAIAADPARRPGRPDPQGGGLDAARGRQAQPRSTKRPS